MIWEGRSDFVQNHLVGIRKKRQKISELDYLLMKYAKSGTSEKHEQPLRGGMIEKWSRGASYNISRCPSIDEYSSKVEKPITIVLISKAAVKGMSGCFAGCKGTKNNRFGLGGDD
jgi:predicted enzyme related to lactoylglutathione lyase